MTGRGQDKEVLEKLSRHGYGAHIAEPATYRARPSASLSGLSGFPCLRNAPVLRPR
jgi:hypothetical protein